MSRRPAQIALWTEAGEKVTVTRQGGALVVRHEVGGRSSELTLPARKGLVVALREACEQALRQMGEAA